MGLYHKYLLPTLIDRSMRDKNVAEKRATLMPLAEGTVLELGSGSGLNLRYYDAAKVQRVIAVDPSQELQALAARRARDVAFPVERLVAGGESIPLPDASVDCAVSTYVLCSVADRAQALREVRRILKPQGRLIFCEHGLAPDARVQTWQRRLEPIWKPLAGGCHLTVPTAQLLQETGFAIEDLETGYMPGPKAMTFTYWGSARSEPPHTSAAA